MLIPHNAFPISKCCGSEARRYALNGVRLEREDGQAVAVASDGSKMLVARWQEPEGFPESAGDQSHREDFATIVPMNVWGEAAKLLPKKRKTAPCGVKSEVLKHVLLEEPSANGTLRMAATDLETVREIKPRSLEGRYPRWRDVIPSYECLEARFANDSEADAALRWLKEQETVNSPKRFHGSCVRFCYVGEQPIWILHRELASRFELVSFGPEAAKIKVDPAALAELLATMDKVNTNREFFGIEFEVPVDAARPIKAVSRASNVHVTGILMPMARD